MGPSLGGALVCCVKRAVPETKGNWHRQTTHSTVINVVAVVPPPAGISQSRRRTLPGNVLKERVGSSRAHSRNYHNEEGTAGVRIERTFSLPITRFRTILASGIEPDSVPCSSVLSSLCACLLSTSGSVHPGYSPTTRIRLIWTSATTLSGNLVVHIDVVNNFMWFDCVGLECKDGEKRRLYGRQALCF